MFDKPHAAGFLAIVGIALLVAAIVWGLIAWFDQPTASITPTIDNDITIKLAAESHPEFSRTYTVKLDNRATLKVEIKHYAHIMIRSGELRQPDGRWILFDPSKVADKIIDPVLVPMVQAKVDVIYSLDKAFRASNPNEFTDETGTKWRRVEKGN